MPGPHCVEIRERALHLCQDGWTTDDIAGALGVGEASVRRWKRAYRERGSVDPLPMGGSEAKLDTPACEILVSLVAQNCDCTLVETKETLVLIAHVEVSVSTVRRALERLGWSRKKKTYRLAGAAEARIAPLREEFLKQIENTDPEKLMFLDECGTNLQMDVGYGRAPVGERAFAPRATTRGKKTFQLSAR